MVFEGFQRLDEAAGAIQDYLRSPEGRKLPDDVQDKAWEMIRPGGSMSFAVPHFAELIYARKDVKDKTAIKLAARCMALNAQTGAEHTAEPRAVAVMNALRRRSGEKAPEGMPWPKAENDLNPLTQYDPDAVKAAAEVPGPEPVPAPAQAGLTTGELIPADDKDE
jgi:hypothetical protein